MSSVVVAIRKTLFIDRGLLLLLPAVGLQSRAENKPQRRKGLGWWWWRWGGEGGGGGVKNTHTSGCGTSHVGSWCLLIEMFTDTPLFDRWKFSSGFV